MPQKYTNNVYFLKIGWIARKAYNRSTCSLSYYEGYNIFNYIVISEFND